MLSDHRLIASSAAVLVAVLGLSQGVSGSDPHASSTPQSSEKSSPSQAAKKLTKESVKSTDKGASAKGDAHGSSSSSKSKTNSPNDDHAPAVVSMGDKQADAHENHADTADHNEHASQADHGDAPKTPAPTKSAPTTASATSAASTPDQALTLLTEGNARWVAGNPTSPNADPSRRRETAAGQNPFVTVITCADSRCPVERLFDRGIGDVFVARVAGNVIDANVAGTVEYGVEHLHTPLIVVMGHTACGAVKAAASGAKVGHNIDTLLAEITPAVQRAKSANPGIEGDALVTAAIRENVYQSMFDLMKTSPLTAEMVSQNKVRLVGAVYDISTGKVEFLGTHPWQDQLIQAMLGSPKAVPAQGHEPTSATANAEHEAH